MPRFARRVEEHGAAAASATDAATVVLVHGAFADPSYWWLVVKELKARSVSVQVRSVPLVGLAADAEHLARRLEEAPGRVILVGHSYGGAVISVAAATTDKVIGLVYVAAAIPEQGESVGEVLCRFGSAPVAGARHGGRPDLDRPRLSLVPNRERAEYASAMSDLTSDERALTQPVIASIFDDRAQAAAWRDLPSWAIVATGDKAIGTEAQRQMAHRAGAGTIELDASHALAVTHPDVVVERIMTALRATAAATSTAVCTSAH